MGGYHLFGGGLLGLDNIHIAHEDEITDYELRDRYPAGSMLQLEPGTECDGFNHYIVTPEALKAYAAENGMEIGDGEYLYWHWAPWQGGESAWKSVRHFVAGCVEKVERMVERGERVDEDDEEESSSSERDEEGDGS